jgi:uncharacterized protein YciI
MPEQFGLGFLLSGTNRTQAVAEVELIQAGHLDHMDGLRQQGKLGVAGPFAENSNWRGVVIYRVKTVEEAKALVAGDPAVKAGRLVIGARSWMTFKGILKQRLESSLSGDNSRSRFGGAGRAFHASRPLSRPTVPFCRRAHRIATDFMAIEVVHSPIHVLRPGVTGRMSE